MKALFYNPDAEFIEQLKSKSESVCLATTSHSEAMLWINDRELALSAIYLNPVDASHSALQFLGQVIRQRPATPIFILDEKGDFSTDHQAVLSGKLDTRGVFKNKKEIWNLMAPIQIEVPFELRAQKKRVCKESRFAGYLAVPIIDFIYSKQYPSDVFMEDDSSGLRFFANKGSEVDLQYLSNLARKKSWLYISESAVEKRLYSLRTIETNYLNPEYLSLSWRTAETLYRAKKYLQELKANGISEKVVNQTYETVQNLFHLTSQVSEDLELKSLIDYAKVCDRAVVTVMLTVLLCKKLRLEKSSIVETLGAASLLQDVSLYRSPFRDLSEVKVSDMSADAKAYYLNHPNLSADQVARSNCFPELTLQIIRQHHERRDYSGFPNRTGGSLLQPLAEVLSIVNAYLDDGDESTEFLHHYSERVASQFAEITKTLKKSH
jgi:hypothetical protein